MCIKRNLNSHVERKNGIPLVRWKVCHALTSLARRVSYRNAFYLIQRWGLLSCNER